jgi:tetratricopeptide (TPR) repeat protein
MLVKNMLYQVRLAPPSALSRSIPNPMKATVAPGKLLYFCDWDWEGANEEFRRGRALDPRDSYANYFSGEIASTLGRSDEALDFYRHAIDQDPLNIKSSSPPRTSSPTKTCLNYVSCATQKPISCQLRNVRVRLGQVRIR